MEVDGFALARSEDKVSPWALAKARFLDDLEPLEQQLYDNATLENIYYTTSNTNRKDAEDSRTRVVIRKLGPLVSAIESYGKAVDIFSQIAPLYQAPIWGCIRVLLVAAEAHSKFYDKVVDVLSRIGDILPRFRDYERIYNPQKHKRLVQALSNAYLDIIVLCTQFRQSIRANQTSKIRRILKPLSMNQQCDDAIEKFRQHKETVEDEARLCHMTEAAEEREARLTVYAMERKRRLLSRLSNVDCTHRHRRLQRARHEGTGIWLQQHVEYIKWESSAGPAVLCCYGIPGCGKSVLASTIIDTLKRHHVAIFYYCDYADKRTLFPSNVFGTLARQILERVELIPEALAVAVEEASHDGDRFTDDSKALFILQQCIESSRHQLHIVLDGLDECSEHSQKVILDGLRQVLHQQGSSVRLFVTARADLDALLKLKPAIPFSRIPVSSLTIALDIEAYVRDSTRHRISNGSLVIGDAGLEEVIVSKLVNGAKGMPQQGWEIELVDFFYFDALYASHISHISRFLWVEFQLNDLCDADSDHHIKKVLDNLPKSLSETYDRLLGRIEDKDRAVMIKRMFKWLVCARQPLHVDEMRESIALTLEDTEWDQDKVITDFNRIVRACSNLVIIDAETLVVQLSHYTVEQYLLQPGESNFHFTRVEAEIMAGEFCVAYLSFANFETRITPYRENTNTDLVALGKIASHPTLLASDHPGRTMVGLWHSLRKSSPAVADIDMTKILRKTPPSPELSQHRCLPYTIKKWIRHTAHFVSGNDNIDPRVRRRRTLFHDLVLEKRLPFQFRPWETCIPANKDLLPKAIFGWALMENHLALIDLACGTVAENLLSTYTPADKPSPMTSHTVLEINKPALGAIARAPEPTKDQAWAFAKDEVQELASEWDGMYLVRSDIKQAWKEIFVKNRRASTYKIDFVVDMEITIADETIEHYPECSYTIGTPVHSWIFYRLLSACRKGHVEAVKACMQDGFPSGNVVAYLLGVAARHGHLSLVEALWPFYSETGFFRQTVLSLKVKSGRNGLFLNALEWAIVSRHDAMVKYLYDVGFRIELFDDDESFFRVFEEAVDQTNIELLDTLLLLLLSPRNHMELALSPRIHDALVTAVEKDNHTVVEAMLRHGVNPDLPTTSGMTPIFHAIFCSSIASLKVLLSYNASTGVTSLGLPLTLAASIGNPDIVEVLLLFEAEMVINVPIEVVLRSSVKQGPDSGLDSKWKDYLCPTPLYMACYYGHLAVSKMLQARGTSPFLTSPKFSIWISRQHRKFVCRTRPYQFSIGHYPKAFEFPGLDDYPLWETPFDAAQPQGHGDIVHALSSTTKYEPDVAEYEDLTNLLTPCQHVPHPWIKAAISNISNKSYSDPTTNLLVLLTAGVDSRAVEIEDRPLLLWALENHPMYLEATLPYGNPYWEELLLYAFKYVINLDRSDKARMVRLMFNITKAFNLATLDNALSFVIHETQDIVLRDVLFDVFLYIVCYPDYTLNSLNSKLVVNLIIQAVGSSERTRNTTSRFELPRTSSIIRPLTDHDIKAITSAYGRDNTLQRDDMLEELFDALCSDGSDPKHCPTLFVAIKHQKDNLIRHWYTIYSEVNPRVQRQWCPILVSAVQTGATASILKFLFEEESKLGTCCDTDMLGQTALGIAVAANDTTVVDLLKSWHGNDSWVEGDPWVCKFAEK